LRLLGSKAVELGIIEAASDSTIQRALKKRSQRRPCRTAGRRGLWRIYNAAFPTFSALATMIAAPPAGWLDHDPGLWQITRSATMKVSRKS
jgi:hypothetical protein